jgi:hypothetical protein
MADGLDRVRRHEHRTRSELPREALARYMDTAKHGRAIPVEDARPDEFEAMRLAERDRGEGKTVRLEDIQNELGLPTR